MIVQDLVDATEPIAPLKLREEWDKVGLQLGNPGREISGPILLTIDLTERVLEEAIDARASAIIAYHPPIFTPIESLTDRSHTERIIRVVWFVGSAFAALGGVLIALNTQLQPNMGFGIIIQVFCAAILGGIGHPYGAMLGAVILGFAENLGMAINWAPLFGTLGLTAESHLFIPTGYKAAVPFSLLILVLLLRPRGLIGAR